MIEYLPFSPLFRLAQPKPKPEIINLRQIPDTKPWIFPPLKIGTVDLKLSGIEDEWVKNPPKPHNSYNFLLNHPIISSEGGIIQTREGFVMEDSLDHTQAKLDLYKISETGIALPKPKEQLHGCWLSLLLGNQDNYFHFLLMNLGRLSQLTPQDIEKIDGVLLPEDLTNAALQALRFALLHVFKRKNITVKLVSRGQSFKIDHLFLPWLPVSARAYTHSGVVQFLNHLYPKTSSKNWPKRFYIDRRNAQNRVLINENELIEALKSRGFIPIQLEKLSFGQQCELFANADFIIGAHGAGLTNIVFSSPKTIIIELIPHALVRWCYRQLAMVNDLIYDCILTQSYANEITPPPWAAHHVFIDHVMKVIDLYFLDHLNHN